MNTRTFLAALVPAALFAASPVLAVDAAAIAAPSALSDAQRDEVRALVKEVLADSGQRGTMADGMFAGIGNDGKVFLKSEDGSFDMNIWGKVQARYITDNSANKGSLNVNSNKSGTSNTNSAGGFELRRVDLDFGGHVGSKAFGYFVELETRLPGGDNTIIGVSQAIAKIEVADGWEVQAGKLYLPFNREQLISSGSQVAVERSVVNNFFSINRAEGAQIQYTDDMDVRVRAAASNGIGNESAQWNANNSKFTGTARAEWLPLGSFKDVNDNLALTDGDKQSMIFGVAGYEQIASNGGSGAANGATSPAYNAAGASTNYRADSGWGVTADGLWKVSNFSFYVAGNVAHAQVHGAGINKAPTPWGLEGQVDYRIATPIDVFVQYNCINDDVTTIQNLHKPMHQMVIGANYFFNSRVKLTGDVAWVISGNNPSTVYPLSGGQGLNTGAGMVNDTNAAHTHADQVAARLQLQVSF